MINYLGIVSLVVFSYLGISYFFRDNGEIALKAINPPPIPNFFIALPIDIAPPVRLDRDELPDFLRRDQGDSGSNVDNNQ